MMRRMMLAAGLVLALVAVGCGSDDGDSGSGGGAAGTSVAVDLKDFAITPDTTSVTSGSVTFDAHNSGPSEHEMVVVKTDLAADALPETEGKVDEEGEGVEFIGEIEEFASELDESATFDLAAGSYVLFCNIPGHYLQGMTVGFTVE